MYTDIFTECLKVYKFGEVNSVSVILCSLCAVIFYLNDQCCYLNILYLPILALNRNENECSSAYVMLINHALCVFPNTFPSLIP